MTSPFGDLVVIANPRSGRGRVGKEMPELERQLNVQRLGYRIVETEGPGTRTGDRSRRAARRRAVRGRGRRRRHRARGRQRDDRERPARWPRARSSAWSRRARGATSSGRSGCPRTFPGRSGHLEGDRLFPIDVARVDYIQDGRTGHALRARTSRKRASAVPCVARAERLPRWLGRSRYFWAFWLSVRKYKAVDDHGERRPEGVRGQGEQRGRRQRSVLRRRNEDLAALLPGRRHARRADQHRSRSRRRSR